jgi:hypothetical protein
MPSTYSPNLALELIGTGDQAGTWGNTTNTNLGTLIEQAISGYEVQSLTSGTTLTLTIPNGATGVARNMYLEFTGDGSTVIVPSNKKLYFVYNNCTSGTITMKVAGQTGVTIPNGERMVLVSNGTDVDEAITIESLTGITTSTVTALGSGAGDSVTSATGTTAIGKNAGMAITSGISNTFVGEEAGLVCTDGILNTGIGLGALKSLTNASGNSAIGWFAGSSITTGFRNTAIGRSSMSANTTGSYNTALGTDSLDNTNYDNTTGVGSSSSVTGDNQVQLGDANTTTYAYGSVQNRSDLRDKADIQDSNLGLAFVMQLQPRMFRWDMREDYRPKKPDYDAPQSEWDAWYEACKLANLTHDGTHKRNRFHYGLVAQELKATMDSMGVDFGGYQDHSIKGGDAVLSLGYEELIAPLIKAIQELKAEFDEYKRTHP